MNALLEQINSAGYAFVEFALPMLVQSSVLIVILLSLDFMLKKKVRAVFRYCIWMLVLVKLILPSSLSSPVSFGYWFGDELPSIKVTDKSAAVSEVNMSKMAEAASIEVSGEAPAVAEAASQPVVTSVAPVTWQGVVFLVWLAAVVVMGLLLLQRAIFVSGLVAQAKKPSSLMDDALKYCCRCIGIRGKVGLKVSANATSPAVCGLFRPVILVPENLGPSLGAGGLRVVLIHELAHIKRGDLWVNLVQTVLQIIYFYNPLLWLANAMIRRVREQAVDETVQVAMGEKARQYPETLVNVAKLAFKRPALSLRLIGVVESKSALKGRIKHMLSRPIPRSAKLGILGLIVVLIVGAILLPMAKAEKQKTEVRSQKTEFAATLPNGVTVELVGLGTAPWESEQQWWRPDGTEIDKPEFKANKPPHKWPTDPNRLQFECAALFKFSNYAGESVSVPEVRFSNGELLTDGLRSSIADDGSQVTYIVSNPHMGVVPNKADISLAIGTWPFKKAKTPSKKFNEKMHEVYSLEDGSVVIRHPLRIDHYLGTLTVDLTCPKKDFEFRIIAELKNGQTEQWHGGSVGKEVRFFHATPRRENIKVQDIKQLIIEYRPYEWITFKNVSLQPEHKTDVQVEVEGEEVYGLRLGLRAEKEQFRYGEIPVLKAVLVNSGERTFSIVPHQTNFKVLVTGKIGGGFRKHEDVQTAYTEIKPGERKEIEVVLDENWFTKARWRRLIFEPGKYSVKVEVPVGTKTNIPRNIRLLSNPVEIEILPAEKPAVQVEVEAASKVSEADKMASENFAGEGWGLWRQRKLADAEEVFKKAVQKDATNSNAWNGLGWSQFQQGKPLNAKISLEKCLKINPRHSGALNGLGWIAKGQGKINEAIGHWEEAVEAAPGATAALNGLAKTYMELEQYDKAVKYYEMWLKVEPDNANAKAGLEKAKAQSQNVNLVSKEVEPADLQSLIDSAQRGGTVIVPKGVYTKPIEINKSLTLKGQSRTDCVFQVTADKPAIFVDTKGKGRVTIEGVTIKWQLATSDRVEYPFALGVKDTKAEVKNCNFVPLGSFKRSPVAVRAIGFTNLTLSGCRFEGFEYVVCYGEGTEGTMVDSLIMDCGHQGIILYEDATVRVERNVITGSRYHAVRSTGGTLFMKDNLIINNANRGVYLGNKSARGTISNNIIMGNGTGISGFAQSKVKIENNVIADSSYAGIGMRESCSLLIRNNIFQGNERGWIMFKEGGRGGNTSYRNTFWQNKTDAENFRKTANSISADPGFVDVDNGDFSLKSGPALEHKQGLTNPEVFKTLWKRWQRREDKKP